MNKLYDLLSLLQKHFVQANIDVFIDVRLGRDALIFRFRIRDEVINVMVTLAVLDGWDVTQLKKYILHYFEAARGG